MLCYNFQSLVMISVFLLLFVCVNPGNITRSLQQKIENILENGSRVGEINK